MNRIKSSNLYTKHIQFEINDTYDTLEKACKARLDCFDLEIIKNYHKILYLDTDIIVHGDLNTVFDVCVKDILYVLEEGDIVSPDFDCWGNSLFEEGEIDEYEDKSAFSSGIMLFNNCEIIK